jgi:4a-hydroxytetrahydrobiopterin dehydratase
MKTLSDQEVSALLKQEAEWHLEDGALVRDWTFSDFATAMIFVNHVAELAEEANHHPDIDIRYNKVRLALISHDAGGLTKRDAAMVKAVSGLVSMGAESGHESS